MDGTPPPASKVEHVTVYKTPEEKLRTQPDAPLGVGKKLRGIWLFLKKEGSPAGVTQWLGVSL